MRFRSKLVTQHEEVPLADGGRWEDIVGHWQERATPRRAPERDHNLCYVVSVSWRRSAAEPDAIAERGRLAEIDGLVRAQGDEVVGSEVRRIGRPDPRTLLGSGVAAEIAGRASAAGADLIVLDAELSPSQMRNLEDATGFSVSDREAVILDVFSRRARSRRARMQVEIAHLEYLRPRIRGLGLSMDQQAGGIVGSRGPGETASELLARRLDGRLHVAREALARLSRGAGEQRKRRAHCKRVALTGYTNAGKTSLMNALTGADLSAAARPFETLDATSRCLTRHGGDVLISDTVGFIRDLPDRLLASFESTLAEVAEASLVAVVVDVSDPERQLHVETSDRILRRVGAGDIDRVVVFTKRDRLEEAVDEAELTRLAGGRRFVLLSTRDPEEVEATRGFLLAAARDQGTVTLLVPYGAARALDLAYGRCRVIEAVAVEAGLEMTLTGEPHVLDQISRACEEVQR